MSKGFSDSLYLEKTLKFTSSELIELRFVMEYRFHFVWLNYRRICSRRYSCKPACFNFYRDAVLEVVSILRKLKKASLIVPASKI